MRISQLSAGLVACLLCVEAYALQLGQVTASSRLGEPLNGRVELFGALPAGVDAMHLELRPDIASAHGSAERAAVASMTAEFVRDTRGYGYIALRSSTAINEPALSFRLRMSTGRKTAVRHYALALPAPLPRAGRAIAAPPVARAEARSASGAGEFGPVRSGQSLWRIMQQAGLTSGNTEATIARIVADNPHAFVGGDANRLRVGVMLSLPGASLPAATADMAAQPVTPAVRASMPAPRVAQLPVVAPSPVTPPVAGVRTPTPADTRVPGTTVESATTPARPAVADPRIAARLAALEEKFAAIRDRYAEQQRQAAAVTKPETTATPERSPEAVVTTAPERAAVRPDSAPALATAAPEPAGAGGLGAISIVLLAAGGALLLWLLARAGAFVRRHFRDRHAHHHKVRTDQVLRAEIARKAEKRLELEGQMRRRIEQTRDTHNGRDPAGNTIERAVGGVAASNDDAEIDEAENRIAHGFYAEAEALLKGVISKTPANHRAKLRLAEIYYLNERHDEFVALAEEIHRLHRTDVGDDNWQRIMRMGKIVAPERPPFSGPQALEHRH